MFIHSAMSSLKTFIHVYSKDNRGWYIDPSIIKPSIIIIVTFVVLNKLIEVPVYYFHHQYLCTDSSSLETTTTMGKAHMLAIETAHLFYSILKS